MILIVDDHPSNLHLLSDLLESRGCPTVATHGGQEALEWVNPTWKGRILPELVLLDVQMSGLSRLDVLSRWRSEAATHDLKVVAVTALALTMRGDQQHLLAQGFDDYLPKPYTSATLFALLERHPPHSTSSSGPAPLPGEGG